LFASIAHKMLRTNTRNHEKAPAYAMDARHALAQLAVVDVVKMVHPKPKDASRA
jgi:hypothetical protein